MAGALPGANIAAQIAAIVGDDPPVGAKASRTRAFSDARNIPLPSGLPSGGCPSPPRMVRGDGTPTSLNIG